MIYRLEKVLHIKSTKVTLQFRTFLLFVICIVKVKLILKQIDSQQFSPDTLYQYRLACEQF